MDEKIKNVMTYVVTKHDWKIAFNPEMRAHFKNILNTGNFYELFKLLNLPKRDCINLVYRAPYNDFLIETYNIKKNGICKRIFNYFRKK